MLPDEPPASEAAQPDPETTTGPPSAPGSWPSTPGSSPTASGSPPSAPGSSQVSPQPSPTAYGRHLGIEVVEVGDGAAELRLPLADHLTNKRGVTHGGAVASLLDSALGAAVVSSLRPEEWCGTVQLSIQFRDPARRGPLRASGRLVRRGRHVAFAEGTAYDADGRPVATAHGTWTIWPRHPDQRRGAEGGHETDQGRAAEGAP